MKKTNLKTTFFVPVRGRPIFSIDLRFIRKKTVKNRKKSGRFFRRFFEEKSDRRKNRDFSEIDRFIADVGNTGHDLNYSDEHS